MCCVLFVSIPDKHAFVTNKWFWCDGYKRVSRLLHISIDISILGIISLRKRTEMSSFSALDGHGECFWLILILTLTDDDSRETLIDWNGLDQIRTRNLGLHS